MRVHVFVVIVSLLGLLPANADDIGAEFDPRPNCGGLTYFVDAPVGQSREVGIGVSVKNYRALLNAETLVSLLNRAAAAGFAQCQADAVAVFITKVGGPLPGRGEPLVTAWKYRSEPQWRIVHNNVSQLVRQEDAQKAASGARVPTAWSRNT